MGGLPVKLISFSGSNKGDINTLNWKTATEINSSRYEVERSPDKQNFETIGTVQSANQGNGSSYRHDDNIRSLNAGNVFYRLKIIDNDGRYTHSTILHINLRNRNEKIVVIGNITSHFINVITPASLLSKPLQADIMSPDGRVVKKITISNLSSIIYVTALEPGKYYIRFTQGGRMIQTEGFIKQ
jgi:hypothetical protein